MTAKAYTVKAKSQPVVVMEAEVARKIRQHSRTSMKAEVCGVLIGKTDDNRTLIDACIPGINATQGGAHVTFTQDAWEHIYKIKDQQYPEEKIVGWYHSHPGFGVFLSEHDLFIQENFFSSPQQVAWVYDPHTDEEGCFGWVGSKTEKLSGMRFGYSQSVAIDSSGANESLEEIDGDFASQVKVQPEGSARREPLWVTWTTRIMALIAVCAVGFLLGREYVVWRIGPDVRAMDNRLRAYEELFQQWEPTVRACEQRFQDLKGAPSGQRLDGTRNPQQPAQPQPKAPVGAGRGNNGKQ